MKSLLLVTMLLSCLPLYADLLAELHFSLDGGKTWSQEFPILEKGKEDFLVKLEGRATEKTRLGFVAGFYTTLYSPQDFASANCGLRKWFDNTGYYFQSLPKWSGSHNFPYFRFIYKVNLGSRQAGSGFKANRFYLARKGFSTILPALPPVPRKSSRNFAIQIEYTIMKNKRKVKFEKHYNFGVAIR